MSAAAPEHVLSVDRQDGVATITLDRPAARNALSAQLLAELHDAVLAADRDDDVDVIVLTGADPAFCAGLDLKELGAGALTEAVSSSSRRGPLPDRSTPLIGAVNGVAVTGGLELALSCDFLVASERARFADTHARVGVMPGWGLTVLLPQAIGLRRAREMSTTGNYVDARTALEWGLVNHVVPHDELASFTHHLALDIVSNDRDGVRRMLQTYREGAELSAPEAWKLEGRVSRSWHPGGAVDPDEVERRRAEVIGRGREQVEHGEGASS